MILTQAQQDMLDGKKGETLAKVMKTLVAYGNVYGAERMVPVTSEYGHTVISFGLGVILSRVSVKVEPDRKNRRVRGIRN